MNLSHRKNHSLRWFSILIFALATLVSTCAQSPSETNGWTRILNASPYNLLVTTDGTFISPAVDGVYRSTDKGSSWIKLNFPSQGRPGTSVGTYGGIVAGQNIFINALDDGIFLSTDDGVTWQATGPVRSSFGTGADTEAFNGNSVIAGYGGFPRGMYRWNGSSWTQTAAGWDGLSAIAATNGWFFAQFFSGGGINVSKDNGSNWSKVYDSTGKLVYVGGQKIIVIDNSGAVIKTDDLGASWSRISTIESVSASGVPIAIDSSTIAVSTASGTTFNATWISKDSGTNWTKLFDNGGFNITFSQSIIYVSSPTGLFKKDISKYITTPNPHSAIATAQVVNGFVVGATINDGGSGYTKAPNVVISGGGGSGAAATATIDANGSVSSITIINSGSKYTGIPSITIDAPPFPPSQAKGTATLINGFVTGVTITDNGHGYEGVIPPVTFLGGGGSGAKGIAIVSNGVVTGISMTASGSGYTKPPYALIAAPPGLARAEISVHSVDVTLHLVPGYTYKVQTAIDAGSTWVDVETGILAVDATVVRTFDVSTNTQLFRVIQVN